MREARQRTAGARVHQIDLDLASFRSIEAAAAEIEDRFGPVDVLVNNAGAILSSPQLTAEGYEATFGVNHLGHFLLTGLLLPAMVAAGRGRVVTVASLAHRLAGPAGLDDPLFERRPYDGAQAYNESKLANVLFTMELARRTAGTGVTANCLHPGTVASRWGSAEDTHGIVRFGLAIARPFMARPARGARTVTYLAASPDVEGFTGGYFVRCRLHEPSALARDPGAARRLWSISEEMVAQRAG